MPVDHAASLVTGARPEAVRIALIRASHAGAAARGEMGREALTPATAAWQVTNAATVKKAANGILVRVRKPATRTNDITNPRVVPEGVDHAT
jgi:hypothetical protein